MNLPKLRFKEFSGEWDDRSMKTFLSIGSGRDHKHLNSGNIPVFGTGGLMRNVDEYLYDGETVFIGRKGTIDKPFYFKGKFWTVDTLFYTHSYKDAVPLFVYNLFQRVNWKNYNEAGGVPSLSKSTIEKIVFYIPKLPEQQKIASFFTAVDQKLNALKKKKELLEQYKKWLMQQIFSQKLRFKDENGNAFPDWEEKKLGDIGSFQTSSIDKLIRENEKEVYLVNYMNVYRHEDVNNETIKNYQVVTAKDSQIESCNLKRGDILFTPSSETPSDIGHSVVIFEDLENAVFSYHLIRFRPNVELNILYSHYFCNIPDVLSQLSKLSTGSTRFTISVKSFSSVEVKLPCLDEQKKIADFLSATDNKIKAVQQQIEKTELWKKGLLQKMFV